MGAAGYGVARPWWSIQSTIRSRIWLHSRVDLKDRSDADGSVRMLSAE